MTESNVCQMPERLKSRHSAGPSTPDGDHRGTKRTGADHHRPSVTSQPRAALCGLSPKHEVNSQKVSLGHETCGEDTTVSKQKRITEHLLQELRPKLMTEVLELFQDWRAEVKYIEPREDSLPLCKRCRVSSGRLGDTLIEDQDGPSDEELVVVCHPNRSLFHLACPFYIYAPDEFQQCLLEDDLQSIKSLIDHLFEWHSRPVHCLICYKAFDTLGHRDNHVLYEKCVERDPESRDGLTETQKVMLVGDDDYQSSEKARWNRIWSTIFPESEKAHSPYLDQGCGLHVSMVRDFWDGDGSSCVSAFLKKQGLPDDQVENAERVLYQLGLEDLLDETMGQNKEDYVSFK